MQKYIIKMKVDNMNYFNWITELIIPISMIVLGFVYNKKSKGEISNVSGFRTVNSMISKESWKYIHKLASRMLKIFGILLIIYIIVIRLISNMNSEYLNLINVDISLLVYILISIYIDMKVKRFNKEKNLK